MYDMLQLPVTTLATPCKEPCHLGEMFCQHIYAILSSILSHEGSLPLAEHLISHQQCVWCG